MSPVQTSAPRPRRLWVVPVAGRLVRDPVTKRPLAADGQWVPREPYWQRRILAGDVTVAAPKE